MGVRCLAEPASNQQALHFPTGTREEYIADLPAVRPKILANITSLIEKSIAGGYYPGAVVLVGHSGSIIYQGVFGNQQLAPQIVPLQFTSIFDLASLTKVIVTTTAVMQLIERGQLDLDQTIVSYWPEFAKNGKENVTVRALLTHTSGLQPILPAWNPPQDQGQRYAEGIRQVEHIALANTPGTVFVYSDINFLALGHLVELITAEPLNQYAQKHIFDALNMTSATFLPPSNLKFQIAPTFSPEFKAERWGQVNDPATERMGGVSGVAGMFANAQDIGTFLQCLLDGGRVSDQNYLLGPLTILKMTTPQSPPGVQELRGLGWDIGSSYSNRGGLVPRGS
ncbi:MAG: beta-lactamase family protein, partial [Proteobacteria bacterium]|nr:beta-lactamase family protein [Pseudomonadota bacterium]